MTQTTNKVVKYNNSMNNVSFRNFNPMELDLLFTICSNIREIGETEVEYSFDKLRQLSSYDSKDKQRFISDLQSTYDKLIQLPFKIEDDDRIIKFVLFTQYSINKKKETVSIKINEDFSYILNELTSNFTRFELAEFTSLSSSYSKTMYRLLKQFRTTGYYKVSISEFRRLLDIPEGYLMSDIDKRILSPIKKELPLYFKQLKINKIKARKGNKIAFFEFLFEKELIPGVFDITSPEAENEAIRAAIKNGKRVERVPVFKEERLSKEDDEILQKEFKELMNQIINE